MERVGLHDAPPARARRPSTGGATPRSGRRCSTRCRRPARATTRSSSHGDDLFAYLEVDDFAALPRGRWPPSRVNDRWQAEMAALIDPLTDPATGFHQRLEEIFHLD